MAGFPLRPDWAGFPVAGPPEAGFPEAGFPDPGFPGAGLDVLELPALEDCIPQLEVEGPWPCPEVLGARFLA